MKPLIKNTLLIFISLTIINSFAAAQITRNNFDKFIDTTILQSGKFLNGNSVFICAIKEKDKKIFLKEWKAGILRQLNDTVFIISLEEQNSKTGLDQKFSWIKKANNLWKLSPDVLFQFEKHTIIFPFSVLVSTIKPLNEPPYFLSGITLIKSTIPSVFTTTLKNFEGVNKLLNNDTVNFIGAIATHPKEELQINDLDLSVNKINVLHSIIPVLNGDGITVSIKENLPDTADIDFGARYRYNALAPTSYSSHATIMATMVAGAGNSYYLGKGVANGATITSSNFNNLLPDADSNYRQNNISVQNHSYGVGIENFYGADAAAYDAYTIKNDSLLFVFSAGNSGNLSSTSGKYAGILNYANSTGSFKMAKNIITVGAVDSFGLVSAASSRGPAFDGRVLPTMVAYGEDGTSGASALVSGTAAVLQQAFKLSHNNQLPSSALIKAVLINSADAIDSSALSFAAGYGNLNAVNAVKTIKSVSFLDGNSTDQSVKTFKIIIPTGISKAKFTLVWNDAPAKPNAYVALVNDLDLELHSTTSNQVWLPWVLNGFANADSLSALPVRKRDSLNNIEQITIDNPLPGNYEILVKGFTVLNAGQNFYIAYQFDTVNTFKWNFPSAGDNIFPAVSNIIRWETTFKLDSTILFYSINNGINWQKIDSNLNKNKNYYYWNAPDTNALAILKMQVGTKVFLSEPFTITSKLNAGVGFNCPDSILLYWNKLPGISMYKLFSLQDKYLQPVATIADTSFLFAKKKFPNLQYAVAPVINDVEGVKSYTINYTYQGVGCYVSSFLGDFKNDTTASLQLQLGSKYLIKKIVFQKLQQGNYIALKNVDNIDGLHFDVTDKNLLFGINTYRVQIILADGKIIYSNSTTLFYYKNSNTVVFPNPVIQNKYVSIQLKNLNNQLITITNLVGQVVYKKIATGNVIKVLFNFLKGIYLITITDSSLGTTAHFKIVNL